MRATTALSDMPFAFGVFGKTALVMAMSRNQCVRVRTFSLASSFLSLFSRSPRPAPLATHLVCSRLQKSGSQKTYLSLNQIEACNKM